MIKLKQDFILLDCNTCYTTKCPLTHLMRWMHMEARHCKESHAWMRPCLVLPNDSLKEKTKTFWVTKVMRCTVLAVSLERDPTLSHVDHKKNKNPIKLNKSISSDRIWFLGLFKFWVSSVEHWFCKQARVMIQKCILVIGMYLFLACCSFIFNKLIYDVNIKVIVLS